MRKLLFAIVLAACTNLIAGAHEHGRSHTARRPSPTWTLDSANRLETFDSSELRGKPHLLVFHLGGDCLHCARQLQQLIEHAPAFKQQDVELLAISSENVAQLRQSLDNYGTSIPFAMLADPDQSAFNAFRAVDPFNQKPLHATIFIDTSGTIRWQSIGRHPFMDFPSLVKTVATIQDQDNAEKEKTEKEIQRPKIFLDKSPRVVAYQLGRLSNEKLLLVERADTDKKYVPVHQAILSRGGMSPQYREQALAALIKLNQSNATTELLSVVSKLKTKSRQDRQTGREIAKLLLSQPKQSLASQGEQFASATESDDSFQRALGFAGLITAGDSDKAWELAKQHKADWLQALSLVRKPELRNAQRSRVISIIDSESPQNVLALQKLRTIPADQADTFNRAAAKIKTEIFREAAIGTLLKVPPQSREANTSIDLVKFLVDYAENTPAENRTTDSFLQAMELVDQLMVTVPNDIARTFRQRLDKVTVRVVRITTVEDEMRYDIPYFAVQAGRAVQIVLDNEDLMAHNLVVTRAGKLKQVAQLGGLAGPGKDYLPENRDDILFATKMIQAHKKSRLTFEAPTEVGEYPYVCTFPQHWSRMYGVMVVVEDLDAWLKRPTKPADPLGHTRTLVKKWTLDDFVDIQSQLENRDPAAGAAIFKEATCYQCHQIGEVGGKVGPALDDIFTKHKHDHRAIMREILEPSHRIDEKYSMHTILTSDGETFTGIIQKEDDRELLLLDNPDSVEPRRILIDDIEDRVKSSTSIMPKALMDNFTKEEILDLYRFLQKSKN